MIAKQNCVTLILFLFSFSAFSQIDSLRRDSIEEIVIYEYDTIYFEPETIRKTDTIFSSNDENSLKNNLIEEIIIYEYDTIYIQPDTIRITDTIFNNALEDSVKVLIRKRIRKFKRKGSFSIKGLRPIIKYKYDTIYIRPEEIRIKKEDSLSLTKPDKAKNKKKYKFKRKRPDGNYSMTGFLPRSFGFSVTHFVPINPKVPSDTLSFQNVFNLTYHFQFNYYTDKYLLSIGLGYTPYHERFIGQYTNYEINKSTATEGSYDLLLLTNNYQLDYYSDYLCLNLILGRKIRISKRFKLNLNLGASAEYLFGYKQGSTALQDSLIRKIDFSALFSPQLTYKLNKHFEFKFSPYYQYAILDDKKHPYSFRQRAGIEIGFNYVL